MTLAESMIELPGGASVHVTEAGRGPALVCLHAGVADARSWRAQQQSFSGRWRVIAYDRRGFGRTRCPPQPFAHVDDLIALLDALRIGQAVLMGCSQGGRIAIDAALAYPDRVRALVLVAAAISGAPEWTDLPAALQPRFDALDAAEARGDLDAVNRLEAEIWLDGPLQAPGRVGGAVRELFLEMNGTALRAPSPGAAIEPPSAWRRLHEIRVPTLALWGPYDFEPLCVQMQHLVAQVPGARAGVIDATAHLPMLERPAAFDAPVGEFLAGL